MRAEYDWILDYQPEVISDLSVLHRVDDWLAVPPQRVFGVVRLLVHYQGALRARLEQELAEEGQGPQRGGSGSPGGKDDAGAIAELSGAGWLDYGKG